MFLPGSITTSPSKAAPVKAVPALAAITPVEIAPASPAKAARPAPTKTPAPAQTPKDAICAAVPISKSLLFVITCYIFMANHFPIARKKEQGFFKQNVGFCFSRISIHLIIACSFFRARQTRRFACRLGIPPGGLGGEGNRVCNPSFHRVDRTWRAVTIVPVAVSPCCLNGAEQGIQMIAARIIGEGFGSADG